MACGLVSAGMSCFSQPAEKADEKSQLSRSDKAFVKEAYEGGLAEIKSGEMAKTKATKPETRELAERLVTDHQKANESLKTIADSKGVSLPNEPTLLMQGKLKLLEKKEGVEFDKAFAEHAVNDHKSDIKTFEKVANGNGDAEVKSFAKKTLPTLKEHLALAEKAAGAAGK